MERSDAGMGGSTGTAREDVSEVETYLATGQATAAEGNRTLDAPRVIGPYHIERALGEGGMGVVYLAEQREPIRRHVAVKVIKVGMDTHEVVARFEAERQTLALMEHPNIAAVLDAGATPDGRPYFVMEHVAGVPVTEYCDRHRLDTRRRIQLFLQICAAVQHAHQKGVIHRDLKPSNVLVAEVDGHAVPKVIDFGIAKATSQHEAERTLFTAQGVFVGTPEYMSPEQADLGAVDIDTRTDIYSLGLILYELLTGTLPFDAAALREAGFLEMRRVIREEEPPKPSIRVATAGGTATGAAEWRRTTPPTLAQQLRGDLDWITLKALEKDRARRYASASEFAADIERHLADEPVSAGPASAWYRAQKFVRKNRIKVTAAAAIVVSLAAGLVVSSLLYVRAERARGDAVAQRAEAETQRSSAEQARRVASDRAEAEARARAAADAAGAAERAARADALRALEKAQRNLYFNNINLVERELSANNIALVAKLLAECPPHLRNWEWHYLSRLGQAEDERLDFPGRVCSLSVGPDGRRLVALVARDNATEVAVIDAATRRVTGTSKLPGVIHHRFGMPLRASGSTAVEVALDRDTTIVDLRVWDAVEGKVRFVKARQGREYAISPDGQRFASYPGGSGKPLAVFDARTGAELASFGRWGFGFHAIGFSPDGQRLLTAEARNRILDDQPPYTAITLVDAATGANAIRLASRVALAQVTAASFSRDGLLVAAATEEHRATGSPRLALWDVPSGRLAWMVEIDKHISAVAISPATGNVVAAANDRTLRVHERATGREIGRLLGHTSRVTALGFVDDGPRLVSAGDDGTVRFWDLARATNKGSRSAVSVDTKIWRVVGAAARRAVYAFTQDRTTEPGTSAFGFPTAAAWRGWEARSGRLLFALPGEPHALPLPPMAVSPDGSRTAVAGLQFERDAAGDVVARASIRVLDSASGRLLTELREPAAGVPVRGERNVLEAWVLAGSGVPQLSLADRGAFVAVRVGAPPQRGSTVGIWELSTGRRIATYGLADRLAAGRERPPGFLDVFEVSPDGRRVLVSMPPAAESGAPSVSGRRVDILDARTGRRICTIGESETLVRPLAFDRQATRLAGQPTKGVTGIWSASTCERVASLVGGDEESLAAGLTFSPDGTRLAAASRDGVVTLWDVATASPLLTLKTSGSGAVTSEFRLRGPTVGVVDRVPGLTFSENGGEITLASVEQDSDGVLVRFTTWSGAPRTESPGR